MGRRPPGGISAGGATILGSRSSAGGSTAFEVMAEYRNQVISPVTTEEVHFSAPMGTRGGAAPGWEFGSSPFGGTLMQDAPSGPSRPDGGLDLQLVLLSLERQLSGPPRPGLENSSPPGAPQATTGGGQVRCRRAQGPSWPGGAKNRRRTQGQEGVGGPQAVPLRPPRPPPYLRWDNQQAGGAGRIASASPPTAVSHTTRRLLIAWRTRRTTLSSRGEVAGLGRDSNLGLS